MRSRTIKPGFFTNEELCSLEPFARLLFAGLWCRADRDGRLEDRPARIRADIFPYNPELDVDSMLESLNQKGLIFRYILNGVSYIQVPKWHEHQRPHPHEVESVIPPIPCNLIDYNSCRDMARQSRDKSLHVMTCQAGPSGPSGPSVPSEPSSAAADGFSLSSPGLDSREKNGRGLSVNLERQQAVWFSEFWTLCWRKVGKGGAEKAFRRAVRCEETWEAVRSAIIAQTPGLQSKEMEFRPHPATWLNQRRWEDEPEAPAQPQLSPEERKRQVVSETFDALIARDLCSQKRI